LAIDILPLSNRAPYEQYTPGDAYFGNASTQAPGTQRREKTAKVFSNPTQHPILLAAISGHSSTIGQPTQQLNKQKTVV
jgi:hypothetical protein